VIVEHESNDCPSDPGLRKSKEMKQKRDQDIANTLRLVEMSKKLLQDLRDNG